MEFLESTISLENEYLLWTGREPAKVFEMKGMDARANYVII